MNKCLIIKKLPCTSTLILNFVLWAKTSQKNPIKIHYLVFELHLALRNLNYTPEIDYKVISNSTLSVDVLIKVNIFSPVIKH